MRGRTDGEHRAFGGVEPVCVCGDAVVDENLGERSRVLEDAALRGVLQHATPLAQVLIDDSIAAYAHRLNTAEGTVLAVRAAAHVIGALPPDEWMHHIGCLTDRLGPDTISLAHLEVLDAGHAWIGDAAGKTHWAPLEPTEPPRPRRADATTQALSRAATWAAPIHGVNIKSMDAAPSLDEASDRL